MIKLSVMYPNQPDATFDTDYYLTSHLALVRRLLGSTLKRGAVDLGVTTPGASSPYLVIGHLTFESMEAYEAAMAAHGDTLRADIPNYTNLQPVFQLSEVVISGEPAAQVA